jgi:hypothetical protein
MDTLFLAPVDGHFAVQWPGPRDLSDTYTVEQFYQAILSRMLSDIMLTRIDWCRDVIWPERAQDQAQTPSQTPASQDSSS